MRNFTLYSQGTAGNSYLSLENNQRKESTLGEVKSNPFFVFLVLFFKLIIQMVIVQNIKFSKNSPCVFKSTLHTQVNVSVFFIQVVVRGADLSVPLTLIA